jgi:hypothetical protein
LHEVTANPLIWVWFTGWRSNTGSH